MNPLPDAVVQMLGKDATPERAISEFEKAARNDAALVAIEPHRADAAYRAWLNALPAAAIRCCESHERSLLHAIECEHDSGHCPVYEEEARLREEYAALRNPKKEGAK
jgi:hypothetical protein